MSELESAPGRGIQLPTSSELTVEGQPIANTVNARFVDRSLALYSDRARLGFLLRLVNFIFSLWVSLFLFVVLPALLVTYYYVVIAADQFVAESQFVVRQVEDTSFSHGTTSFDTGQGGPEAEFKTLSQDSTKKPDQTGGDGTGNSSGSAQNSSITTDDQDGYVVASYIQSRAIVDDLSRTMDLRMLFQRPEADFWARLKDHASQEDLTRFWLNMVSAYVDRPSGVVKVDVQAFRRQDALAIAKAINALAAVLVNKISLRARQDALERAKQEVDRSESAMHSVMAEFEAFRNGAGLIDPVNVATNTSDLLKLLLSQRIQTDSDLFVLREMRSRAPEIPGLEARLKSLDARIAELQSTLTAKDKNAGTIAATLVKFEELQVRERLAEEIYTTARNDEERARQTAERRWLYIASFIPPALPDDSEYPERIGFSADGAVLLLVFWSIVALLRMSILDHRA